MNREEILKEIEKLQDSAMRGPGFTPYLAKKRDSLYKKLGRIKNE